MSSLTCHDVQEIGRARRVGRGCYEDASDFSAISRACQADRTVVRRQNNVCMSVWDLSNCFIVPVHIILLVGAKPLSKVQETKKGCQKQVRDPGAEL